MCSFSITNRPPEISKCFFQKFTRFPYAYKFNVVVLKTISLHFSCRDVPICVEMVNHPVITILHLGESLDHSSTRRLPVKKKKNLFSPVRIARVAAESDNPIPRTYFTVRIRGWNELDYVHRPGAQSRPGRRIRR